MPFQPDRPCANCPFRADHQPGTFGRDRYQQLAGTIGRPGAEVAPDGPMFACHHSPEDDEHVCVGWLAVHGHNHLGVRLAVLRGRLDPPDTAGWPPLVDDDYDAMVDRVAGPEGTCLIDPPRRR